MENHCTSSLYLDLGVQDYQETLLIQKRIHGQRCDNLIPDTFIFVEHKPVFTIGREAKPENYTGLNPILVERGGDVTYHGPGQLVMYPIVRVFNPGESPDLRKFVRWVEEIVTKSLENLGFSVHLGNEPGLWVSNGPMGDRKVASVGMKVRNGVSFHGVSINYGKESLTGFSKIRPCGLDPTEMGYLGIEKNTLMKELVSTLNSRYGKIESVGIAEI